MSELAHVRHFTLLKLPLHRHPCPLRATCTQMPFSRFSLTREVKPVSNSWQAAGLCSGLTQCSERQQNQALSYFILNGDISDRKAKECKKFSIKSLKPKQ